MSKEYEYKCPDCNENINYGDKFCKNCSCKLDWDDEETESSLTDIKKEEQSARKKESKGIKKDNIKIGLIFILIQTFCYITGILTNNFSFKIESGEFIGYNIFLIIGIINIIKSKNYIKTFYKKKLNILLLLLILVCLIISIVLSINSISIFNNNSNKNIDITEININKYLNLISEKESAYIYLGSSDSKYTLELTEIIETLDVSRKINLYYLDISKLNDDEYTSLNNSLNYLRENEWEVPLLLVVQATEVINDNLEISTDKELKDFFEIEILSIFDQQSSIPEDCIYTKTEDVKSIEVNAESASGVGDVFSKPVEKLEYRIKDNKVGDIYNVNYKLNGDENSDDCNQNWYSVTMDDGKEGYIWGGYYSMYVKEIE